MKKFLRISILLVILTPQGIYAQLSSGYEIHGRIMGLKEGEKVTLTLVEKGNWMKNGKRDSGYVKNGEFYIKGIVPEGPRSYSMEFDQHKSQACMIAIDNNEKISVRYEDSVIEKIHHSYLDNYFKIEGSPTNYAFHLFSPASMLYSQNRGMLRRELNKIKDSVGYNKLLVDGFILQNKSNIKALYYIFFRNTGVEYQPALVMDIILQGLFEETDHASFWPEIYSKLSPKMQNSYYGKELKLLLPLSQEQLLPEFTLPTADGNRLSLHEVVAKGKITLVHFWAKNSVNRKEYDDDLRAMYNKYHSNGFNIIGVSSDLYLEEWKDALESEKYPWYNVLDLKGGLVDSVYHERGTDPLIHNTTNVLLDGNGRIISWDPTGVMLQWQLQEHLGSQDLNKNSQVSK